MWKCISGFFSKPIFSLPNFVECIVLAMITLTCSVLIVFVPLSRVYCGIAIALVLIYGLRLWRLLPREKEWATREAYRMADTMLRARQRAIASSNAMQRVMMSTMVANQMNPPMGVSMTLPHLHPSGVMPEQTQPAPRPMLPIMPNAIEAGNMLPQHAQAFKNNLQHG